MAKISNNISIYVALDHFLMRYAVGFESVPFQSLSVSVQFSTFYCVTDLISNGLNPIATLTELQKLDAGVEPARRTTVLEILHRSSFHGGMTRRKPRRDIGGTV